MIALVTRQRKLSGRQSRTSSNRPCSESTPPASPALSLRLQPQHVAELHAPDAGNPAQRLAPDIAAQPLAQQHSLRQSEVGPGILGIGVEATRHRRDRALRKGEDRIELEKIERRGFVRDRKHPRPCVALDDIPAARWLGEIAQRGARFLLGAALD